MNTDGNNTYAWVIVRYGTSAQLMYWSASDDDGWSTNHMDAVRFSRERDASAIVDYCLSHVDVRVEEHGWSS